MGIIVKQSIKGSIWSYLGVLIGFVTTSYLYPKYLTTDVVGLFSLFTSYAMLFGQISLLGLPGVTARLFPRFRDKESGHHGFLSLSLLIFAIGFILFALIFGSLSSWMIASNSQKSALFSEYIMLLLPLTFFMMVFIQLDTYNKVLYDSVSGTFLQEFLQRVLLFAITLVFAFGWINLHQLILAYAIAFCMKAGILFFILLQRGELKIRIDKSILTPAFKKEILDVALFSIITGLGTMVVFNIDKIIINQLLDLSSTGVYTIAFYFGTLVIIPSRPLLKIAGTLISDAWSKTDTEKVKDIYYKSCINQFAIGGFLFLGIWVNIDNILLILGTDYAASKWVIFFIGLGYLFDMLTGANALVIGYSRHYRVALVFILILIVLVIFLLYVLIPLWGITGAAIAIAAALFLNNLMRHIFLVKTYHMQPFNLKFILVSGLMALATAVPALIPQQSLIPDILLRSAIVGIIYVPALIAFRISPEINQLYQAGLSFISKRRS